MQEDDEILFRERDARNHATRWLSTPEGLQRMKEQVKKRKFNLKLHRKDISADVRPNALGSQWFSSDQFGLPAAQANTSHLQTSEARPEHRFEAERALPPKQAVPQAQVQYGVVSTSVHPLHDGACLQVQQRHRD